MITKIPILVSKCDPLILDKPKMEELLTDALMTAIRILKRDEYLQTIIHFFRSDGTITMAVLEYKNNEEKNAMIKTIINYANQKIYPEFVIFVANAYMIIQHIADNNPTPPSEREDRQEAIIIHGLSSNFARGTAIRYERNRDNVPIIPDNIQIEWWNKMQNNLLEDLQFN